MWCIDGGVHAVVSRRLPQQRAAYSRWRSLLDYTDLTVAHMSATRSGGPLPFSGAAIFHREELLSRWALAFLARLEAIKQQLLQRSLCARPHHQRHINSNAPPSPRRSPAAAHPAASRRVCVLNTVIITSAHASLTVHLDTQPRTGELLDAHYVITRHDTPRITMRHTHARTRADAVSPELAQG